MNPRCLELPGRRLCPGDRVLLRLSRGEVVEGVFAGYASGFLALAPACGLPPNRFIMLKRLVEVVVLGTCG